MIDGYEDGEDVIGESVGNTVGAEKLGLFDGIEVGLETVGPDEGITVGRRMERIIDDDRRCKTDEVKYSSN